MQYAELTIQSHRLCIKTKHSAPFGAGNKQQALRGKINGFSKKSRKRLLDLTASINFANQKVIFITLTYPKEFPQAEQAKQHLRAFMERIRRRYPKASAIWRMEFQKRGAPHFHLLFFNLPFIPKDEVKAMWGEIIGYSQVFTRIEMIGSWKKAVAYVAKYIAKESERSDPSGFNFDPYLHAGRVWGIFQRENLPLGTMVVIRIPMGFKLFWDFRRYCKRYWRGIAMHGDPVGWTIYHEDPMKLLRLLEPWY